MKIILILIKRCGLTADEGRELGDEICYIGFSARRDRGELHSRTGRSPRVLIYKGAYFYSSLVSTMVDERVKKGEERV